jgi:hypothetical protein
MRVERSLAEMLMNAIASNRVWGVQFSRKHGKDPGDERRTFEDLNKVIAKRIDSALEVARESGHQESFRSREEDERRGELKGLEWARANCCSPFGIPTMDDRIAELKKGGA